MMPAIHSQLIRILADIDGILTESEDIAANTNDDGERQAALDFLIEFQPAKLRVERMLGRND
jgi:hypothetical protein